MKKEEFEKLMTFILIKGSKQSEYVTLIKGFVSQIYLGVDNHPKIIAKDIDILSNHRIYP